MAVLLSVLPTQTGFTLFKSIINYLNHRTKDFLIDETLKGMLSFHWFPLSSFYTAHSFALKFFLKRT